MKINTLFIALLFVTASCTSQAVAPRATTAPLPTKTSLPASTSTHAPTETASPAPTSSNIFGSIPLNSVQAFSIEPVAQAVFEETLKGFASTGSIRDFRVDSIAVFPSGEGTLIAEIFYSLHTDADLWPEDGGSSGTDGWITGKCSRFDMIATETEHQLTKKRLCS
ncbi:MAG TPA: hypothetical protein VFY26_19945 [Anaerolineales bacterium]|nr:hypothetical protein [Anaerolineales bacterium]